MLDTFKHKGLRARLAEKLKGRGIVDLQVLAAIEAVPRHWFVAGALMDEAYEDKALPIASLQTISQPFTVAYMTQTLDLKPKMKILEIGTGSGYQTAILCEMGLRVFSVEIDTRLHFEAKERLSEMNYVPHLMCGDGSKGWSRYAPYERIIVTAACPQIPRALQTQLDTGGKMILPVGDKNLQTMTLVSCIHPGEYTIQYLHTFKFVPLRGKYGFKEESE